MNGIIKKINSDALSRKNSHHRDSLSGSSPEHKKDEDSKFDNKEDYYKFAKDEEWDVVSKTSEVMMAGMDDPFYQRWSQIERENRQASDFKDFRSYKLKPMIVKSNDDLR